MKPGSLQDLNEQGRLLIIFANSLDPNQNQQNAGPDLDSAGPDQNPKHLNSDGVPDFFFKIVNFEINQQMATKALKTSIFREFMSPAT